MHNHLPFTTNDTPYSVMYLTTHSVSEFNSKPRYDETEFMEWESRTESAVGYLEASDDPQPEGAWEVQIVAQVYIETISLKVQHGRQAQ